MDSVKSGGKSVLPLLAGLAWSLAVLAAATLIVSLLLSVTGLREDALPVYVHFIHGVSVFTGGFVAARRSSSKGWYRGGMLGICYGLAVSVVTRFGFDAAWSLDTLAFLAICFATGALGGMLGINARRR